jgi:hypothetical protein
MGTRHMLRRVANERYFYTHMSWVTSSHFAKYFCDTYSKYITPCAVMTYATPDAIRVMHLTFTGDGLVRLSG